MHDLSEFDLEKNALENHEEVIVLGTSENPENGNEDYFIHMIVKSVKSGDTINVLFWGARETYGEEIKSFIAPDDIFLNIENKKIDLKSIKKVYSNPEYIDINWRKYPSIIGKVMTLYDTKGKSTEEIIEDALDMIKESN